MLDYDSLPRILILDANASAAQVTRAGVQRAVPQASIAVEATPENAWINAQREPPDLLIIDPVPAELASAWLIQTIKATYPSSRVIVLASAPTSAIRRNGGRVAIDVYLEKPAPLSALMQAVQKVLESKSTH